MEHPIAKTGEMNGCDLPRTNAAALWTKNNNGDTP